MRDERTEIRLVYTALHCIGFMGKERGRIFFFTSYISYYFSVIETFIIITPVGSGNDEIS